MRRGWNRGCSCSSTWRARRDWPSGSVRSPFTASSTASSSTSPQPIVAARGEIHRYIGDELIATWKLEEGIADGRCVAACFAAIDQLAKRAPDYRREFGAAVTVRAGLHCGPVVTGEMGTVRKEIVFLGDTVNTAARIQELCRQTGDRVIASAELIDRLELPAGIAKRSLGDLRLRGKGADLALYALTKAPLRAGRSSARGREDRAGENAGRACRDRYSQRIRRAINRRLGVRELSQSPLGSIS